MAANLPTLTSNPKHFADCCLSLSSTLINTILNAISQEPSLNQKDVVFSIGSGTGLLEALLLQQTLNRSQNVVVEGVEVHSTSETASMNRYLPEEYTYVVNGTWDLCSRAREASVWLFVYPREPVLVTKYIETFSNENLKIIIWLGPKVDWEDFEGCFTDDLGWGLVEVVEDAGVVDYEMMVIVRRRDT